MNYNTTAFAFNFKTVL